MKGLIRNNFYTLEGSLKATILVVFIATVIVAILSIFFPQYASFASYLTASGILGSFGALAGATMQKDGASKWNKFELTMPISRNDVIKARYISFMLFILIGLSLAILSTLAIFVVTGYMNLEREIYGFVFGFSFAIAIPTFMMPLVLIFGADKNETLLLVSIAMGLGLFFGSSVIFAPFLKIFSNANLLFRIGYLIFSVLLYFLSYLLSIYIYKKKEF